MKFTPASRAFETIRTQSSTAGLPMGPNIMAPRQYSLTVNPVRPRGRYLTETLLSMTNRPERRLPAPGALCEVMLADRQRDCRYQDRNSSRERPRRLLVRQAG